MCNWRRSIVAAKLLLTIRKIINEMNLVPDLIVGDFNGETTIVDSMDTLNKYPLFNNLNQREQNRFLQYYTSHHKVLEEYGYKPSYTVGRIGSTSKFGGTPDWMYYQEKYLTPILVENIPLLEYTDHNGVLVTFKLF